MLSQSAGDCRKITFNHACSDRSARATGPLLTSHQPTSAQCFNNSEDTNTCKAAGPSWRAAATQAVGSRAAPRGRWWWCRCGSTSTSRPLPSRSSPTAARSAAPFPSCTQSQTHLHPPPFPLPPSPFPVPPHPHTSPIPPVSPIPLSTRSSAPPGWMSSWTVGGPTAPASPMASSPSSPPPPASVESDPFDGHGG